MHISHIKISSILGIDDLEFTPEGFNSIEGPNGTGKTSVLEAIKAAVQPGHDATLLRNGAEKGEIVFVLDDGSSITKKVGKASSSTEVRDAEGKKVGRPAEAISRLTDMLSINPVSFLTAPKKDRVKVLLEAMPIEVDTDHLSAISGISVTAQDGIHGLGVIDAVAKQVYDDRTGTNRAVKEKDATINQLRLAMPDPVEGVDGSEDELVAKVEEARAAQDAELARINTKLSSMKDDATAKIDAIRAKLQADIDALKEAATAEVEKINTELASNQDKAAIVSNKAKQKFVDIATPINEQLAIIRNNRNAAAKREQTLETIETLVVELEDLRADAESQSKALVDIEKYKSELLASLPIRGLEVRDGEIFRDNVAFDRLNTAQQVEVAVEVAKLRAGELGVVCVDRIECLDSATLEAFRESALASNLQLFVTRVGDGDFSITTQN